MKRCQDREVADEEVVSRAIFIEGVAVEARKRENLLLQDTKPIVGMQTNLGPSGEPMAWPYQNLLSRKLRDLLGEKNPF